MYLGKLRDVSDSRLDSHLDSHCGLAFGLDLACELGCFFNMGALCKSILLCLFCQAALFQFWGYCLDAILLIFKYI